MHRGNTAHPSNAPKAFDRLHEIVRRLRAPDGCTWDRQQTPRTLRASLLEEAWECVSAIDSHDDENLEEELGDLYMLVTMIAWMKEQEGAFTVKDALDRICGKLERRHPHVFGGSKTSSVEQITVQWEAIKSEEEESRKLAQGEESRKLAQGEESRKLAQGEESRKLAQGMAEPISPSVLHRIPKSLPPLEKAYAIQRKAAKIGFDWPAPEPVWEKLSEEIAELRGAVAGAEAALVEEEIGDLLFTVVNLSRLLKVDPALALQGTNRKFERRFREVERRLAERNVRPADAGLDQMDALWNQVKSEESRKFARGEESRKFARGESEARPSDSK